MAVSLLPPNATAQERALEAAMARLGEVPVPIGDLWNPDLCPLELLPWLAWALSVDTWSPDWPEPVKRAVCRQSLSLHRRKGTVGAVRRVVESFGGLVAIREWWETSPRGDPHTFELTLSLDGIVGEAATAQYVQDVIAQINQAKPLRSWFTFTQALRSAGALGVLGRARPAVFRRLQCAAPIAPPMPLLLEDGSELLLEDGSGLLQE